MNWKRGLWIGALFYLMAILLNIILVNIIKSSSSNNPVLLWVGLAGLVILTGLFSFWYFSKEKADWKEGLYLGIFFIVLGFIVDLVFLGLGSLVKSAIFSILIKKYLSWQFGLGIISILITSVLIGQLKSGRSKGRVVKTIKRRR